MATRRSRTWRYAEDVTDSMYVSIGDARRGYNLWLRRINTVASFAPDSLSWMGGVRVYATGGQSWTAAAQLSHSGCRD